MRKFLFLLMAFLLGFSASATTVKLAGTFTSWETNAIEMPCMETNCYVLDYNGTISNGAEFKIIVDGTWYGMNNSEIKTNSGKVNLYTNNGNVTIKEDLTNPRFVFYNDSKEVYITTQFAIFQIWGQLKDGSNWGDIDLVPDNGVYAANIADCNSGEFLIKQHFYHTSSGERQWWKASSTNISFGKTLNISTSYSNNFKLTSSGDAIVIFNPKTGKINVSSADEYTVYFVKPTEWKGVKVTAKNDASGDSYFTSSTGDEISRYEADKDLYVWTTTKGQPSSITFTDTENSNNKQTVSNVENAYGHVFGESKDYGEYKAEDIKYSLNGYIYDGTSWTKKDFGDAVDGVYTMSGISCKGNVEFGIERKINDNRIAYIYSNESGNPAIVYSKDATCVAEDYGVSGSNWKLPADGDYTFTFNPATMTLKVDNLAYKYGNTFEGEIVSDDNKDVTVDYTLTANADGTLTIEAEYYGKELTEYITYINFGNTEKVCKLENKGSYYTVTTEDKYSLGDNIKVRFYSIIKEDGNTTYQMPVEYSFGSANSMGWTPSLTVEAEAKQVDANSATISWTVTPKHYKGSYKVYVGETEMAADATSYQISGLEPQTEYTYTVKAQGDNVSGSKDVTFTTAAEGKTVHYYGREKVYINNVSDDTNTYPVTIEYDFASNADGTLTLSATWKGAEKVPSNCNYGFWFDVKDNNNYSPYDVGDPKGTKVDGEYQTYTYTFTNEKGNKSYVGCEFGIIKIFFAYRGQNKAIEITGFTFGDEQAMPELTASLAVTNVKASAEQESATITYNVEAELCDSYYVEVKVGDQVVKVEDGSNSATFTGLTAGTEYTYSVKAIATEGELTSEEVTGTFSTTKADAKEAHFYGTTTGTAIHNNTNYPITIDYEFISNTNGTLTINATWTGSTVVPSNTDYRFYIVPSDGNKYLETNAAATKVEDCTYTYTFTNTKGTGSYEGCVFNSIDCFFAFELGNLRVPITGFTFGDSNEKPSSEASLSLDKAEATNITSNSVTIDYTVTASHCDYIVFADIKETGKDEVNNVNLTNSATINGLEANTEYTVSVYAETTDASITTKRIEFTFTTAEEGTSNEAPAFNGDVVDKITYNDKDYTVKFDYKIEAVNNNLKVTLNMKYETGCGIDPNAIYMDLKHNGNGVGEVHFSKASNVKARVADDSDLASSGTLVAATTSSDYNENDAVEVAIRFSYSDGGHYSYTVSEYTTYGQSGTSSVNNVAVDSTEAPVEYYNLQGVKIVGQPAPGLYIRRQGNATSKVVIR